MKKPLPALEAGKTGTPLARQSGDGSLSPAAARRQAHRQFEELKVQVLELAQRNMEVSLRVLKTWIAADGRK